MGNLGTDIAGWGLSECHTDDRLHRILDAALRDRTTSATASRVARSRDLQTSPDILYWDAEFFNLERVQLFVNASPAQQQAILSLANRALMEEAYFIEKAGMGYMAKMALLAETTQERMLYSLFAADETLHLSQLRPYFTQEPVVCDDPFLNLLAEVVESPDKTLLLFVLQVVLEGWGLSHYRALAKGCRQPALANLFHHFLQAEAQHHATGMSLFQQTPVMPATQSSLVEVLQAFLQMIRVGPQRLVAAIAQVNGGLSRSQQVQILEELDCETHSGLRLKLLRSLMQSAGAAAIVEQLEHHHHFEPLPAHLCVC